MKDQRFDPSSTAKNGGCKEKHKVAITRKSGGENKGGIGKAFDKWGGRFLLAYNLFEQAKPYILEFINYLQQFM